MTKDELREKRKRAIESLNDIKAILGLDELYIDELEKENAELKKKNLDTQDAVTMQMYTNKANKEVADRQLTKAKELLERLLITSCNSDVLNLLPNCSEVLRVRVEAEQFLKGVEK